MQLLLLLCGKHLLCLSDENRQPLVNALNRILQINLIEVLRANWRIVERFLERNTSRLRLANLDLLIRGNCACRVVAMSMQVILSTDKRFEPLFGIKRGRSASLLCRYWALFIATSCLNNLVLLHNLAQLIAKCSRFFVKEEAFKFGK